MDGKVIKEESSSIGSNPCSPSPLARENVPSGKENRRITTSPFNTSEILTRSRTKVLSKENSHPHPHHRHHHHHHHHHHQMSESPKERERDRDRDREENDRENGSESPPPPPRSISISSSHPQHVERTGSLGGFGHQFSSPHSTTATTARSESTPNGQFSRRTPSPPVTGGPGSNSNSNVNNNNNSSSNNNSGGTSSNNAKNSGSSVRTPSSSSNSSGSGGSATSMFSGDHGSNGRHIVKIKRFLGTLLHFGCDISMDVGDRVRALVFNLVSGHLSIEVFHHSLQEVTSFPLRPFVLPFLRTHLPLLQREISHLARLAKQNSLSYIRSHEQAIFEAGSSPGEPCDIFHSEAAGMGLATKRKSSESLIYENGEGDSGYVTTPKRHHSSMFTPPFFLASSGGSSSGGGGHSGGGDSIREYRDYYSSSVSSAYPLIPMHHVHGHSHHDSSLTSSSSSSSLINPSQSSNQNNSHSSSGSNNNNNNHNHNHINSSSNNANHHHHHSSSSNNNNNVTLSNGNGSNCPASNNNNNKGGGGGGGSSGGAPEDEWKNIHVMLNCILSMVEKTKRALAILQNRNFHNELDGGGVGVGVGGSGSVNGSGGGNISSSSSACWLRRPTSGFSNPPENSEDFKRQAGEMMAQALRATEDRVAEVKRRAEEAVQEVKRQALVELQRAVAAAEARACERVRLDRVLIDPRRNPGEALIVGQPIESTETCWNCGRTAHETCSGCNQARYCSAFCQHRNWESHRGRCFPAHEDRDRERERDREADSLDKHENSNSSRGSTTYTKVEVHHPVYGRSNSTGGERSHVSSAGPSTNNNNSNNNPGNSSSSGASESKVHVVETNSNSSPINVGHPSPSDHSSHGSNNL